MFVVCTESFVGPQETFVLAGAGVKGCMYGRSTGPERLDEMG